MAYLVVGFSVVEEELKIECELLHIVVLLHFQLLLDLHHVNRLRHYVVVIRLVPLGGNLLRIFIQSFFDTVYCSSSAIMGPVMARLVLARSGV